MQVPLVVEDVDVHHPRVLPDRAHSSQVVAGVVWPHWNSESEATKLKPKLLQTNNNTSPEARGAWRTTATGIAGAAILFYWLLRPQ
jgi:hypothetical protein